MQLDVKNVRKWLLILSQTWFQLCFNKSYLKWAEEYFKRQDTVTKQYSLITGLTSDQVSLDPLTITSLTKCFLKQINFFFVILSTNKKEKLKERRSTAVVAELRHRLLSEKEYMHYIDLLQCYFDKEDYYKIANDIISTFSDQMQNFGDHFPVHYENENIVLISSILMKIEESIIHEMTMQQNHNKIYQKAIGNNKDNANQMQNKFKFTPKRAEIYISCLQKLNHDTLRSTPYFKTFCTKVIKIGEDLLNEWMKGRDQDQEYNSKVLIDLFFLLMSYQERIFIAQLEKSYRKQDSHNLLDDKKLSSEDIIILREKMYQMAIHLLNRYHVLKNLSEYVKNIVFKFIDQLYCQDNLDLFKGEVVYLGNVLKKESKTYLLEDTLQMILDVIKIRSKLNIEQRTSESVQSQVNQHTLIVNERNLSQSQKSSASADVENVKPVQNVKQQIDTQMQQDQNKEQQDQNILQGVIKNYLNMGKLLNMEEVILLDEYIGNASSDNFILSENKQDLQKPLNSKNSLLSNTSMAKKGDSLLMQLFSKSDFSGDAERNDYSANNSFIFVNSSFNNNNNNNNNGNSEILNSQKNTNQANDINSQGQPKDISDNSESNEFVRLGGSQFLSKQEIDKNISRLIQAKKSGGDGSEDIFEGNVFHSKDEAIYQSPKKSDFKNKLSSIKEKGEYSPKQNEGKNRRQSLYIKDEQQNKLEYLVIQFNNLMYKVDIICNNSNFTDLENQTLSCKYTQQIIYCFLTPHQSQRQPSPQTNNSNTASSSFNLQHKQKNTQIIRYPPSINTLFFVFYSYLNVQQKLDTLQILQQVGNKSSRIEKFSSISNSAFLIKSFFQIYNKANSSQEPLQEIKNQWKQILDYCLNESTDPIFGVIAIVINKDIFSTYPETIKEQDLIERFLDKSKIILGYLTDPTTSPDDFNFILSIILANQDFLTACSTSFPLSSLSALFPLLSSQQPSNPLQTYLLGANAPSLWNHASINDEYSKQIRSTIFRSIIILLKNLYQIQEIKKMSFSLINKFITIFTSHFISLFTPNINFSTLFSQDVIVHLEALFFTVLLDQHQSQEIKMQIWEFILKSINSSYNTCKQIHYHSIQFINSFALADQMSSIQKQTINKIMRTITQILQEKVQKDILVTRQLLNCLQNWIFNFRYFEINCRKHFKDTKRFLENLIKALHNLSQIDDLQYDVQFFLSQLLKNYLDQRQDDTFNFQLEDVIDNSNDLLMLQNRESIYHTVSCHESMKQQQKIVYEISKIEKEVLKVRKVQLMSADFSPQMQSSTSQSNLKKTSGLQNSVSQLKKFIKKNSNLQTQDISEYIPEFINNRYICFCLDSDKLLSFLIDTKSQIYAIMRDLNGKFIWKIKERSIDSPISKTIKSFDKFEDNPFNLQLNSASTQANQIQNEIVQKPQKAAIGAPNTKDKKLFQKPLPYNQLTETHKSEGNLLNLIKSPNIEEKRKISKDIPRPSKNDQLQKIIEQIIYFIHESIIQTENSNEFDQVGANLTDNYSSRSPQKLGMSSSNSFSSKNDLCQNEIVTKSLKSFVKEVPFMIKDTNRCNFIDHSQETFTDIITQIDQYSTSDKIKIGILYMGKDQQNEYQILQAQCGSSRYERFLERLGEKIKLSDHQGFLGGLSPDRDGEYTIYNHFYNCEVVYHVATMMPTKNKEDKQFVSKKRHIGNDFVNIIWSENMRKYQQCIIPSQLTTAYIVIHPLSNGYYRINLIRKDKLGDFFFPWLDKSVVHESFLDILVKIVSLQASYCVQQYQARYHQNLPQNTLRPYKSRQNLLFQLQEQLSIPNKSNQLISELFSTNQSQQSQGNLNENQNNKQQQNNNNNQQNPQVQQNQHKQASNSNISNNITNRIKI